MPSLYNVWALMNKNFIRLRRNVSNLAFIFLLPAIQVSLFCLAVGHPPNDLRVAVVNDEFSAGSDGASSCVWPAGCEFDFLSCRFLDTLFHNESDLVRVDYADYGAARAAVEDGKAWGLMVAPANFSQQLLKRLVSAMDATAETINKSSINVSRQWN